MSRRLVIFDFCDTLTDFQTADRFVDFVLAGHWTPGRIARNAVRSLLYHLRILKDERHKRAKLSLLKGIPAAVVRDRARGYLDTVVLPRIRAEVLEEVFRHKREGSFVVIASGGYDAYLSLFVERYGLDKLVSTEILYSGGVCAGTFAGPNCMGDQKWRMLQAAVPVKNFDLREATAYSDSPTDMAMLKAVGHPVIVARTARVDWNPGNRFPVLVVK